MKVYGFTGGSHCDDQHTVRLLDAGAEKVFSHMNDIARVLHAA
jgi:hypothetical protein